jgi:hypothetical protein
MTDNQDDNCQIKSPALVDARGEQELPGATDQEAVDITAAPSGTNYDPEIWGRLPAACGALR